MHVSGASGGGGFGPRGGFASIVTSVLQVVPGQTYGIIVGGRGGNVNSLSANGGYNGGGRGADYSGYNTPTYFAAGGGNKNPNVMINNIQSCY